MKKLNAEKKQLFHFYVTAALYLCILISLSACKTAVPVYDKVDVLSLLDNKSSFYLRIPTSVDSEQFEKILQAKVKGLSEANARRITERIDTIYIGLERTKKGTEYQLAASCNFPKVVIKSAFSKGNPVFPFMESASSFITSRDFLFFASSMVITKTHHPLDTMY